MRSWQLPPVLVAGTMPAFTCDLLCFVCTFTHRYKGNLCVCLRLRKQCLRSKKRQLLGVAHVLLGIVHVLPGVAHVLLGIVHVLLGIAHVLLGVAHVLLGVAHVLLGVAHVLLLHSVAGYRGSEYGCVQTCRVLRKRSDCWKALCNPQKVDLCVHASSTHVMAAEMTIAQNPPDARGLLRCYNYKCIKEYESGKSVKVCRSCALDVGHSVQNITMPKSRILSIAHNIAHELLDARG